METEVWVRNPLLCIKECRELAVSNLTFDHGLLRKRGVYLPKFMEVYYGLTLPWRAIIISDAGAQLISRNSNPAVPEAVFPTWAYGQEFKDLERLVAEPVGLDEKACESRSVPLALRPVFGQAHYVVLTHLPELNKAVGRAFIRQVAELQEENPECRIFVHGLYSFRAMFGLGLAAVDTEPRSLAAKGKLSMPNGKELPFDSEEIEEFAHWFELLGMDWRAMDVPRNRCIYNIKSAQWAAKHFRENVKFKHRGFDHIDPDDVFGTPLEQQRVMVRRVTPGEDDKFLCNVCSLQSSCRYFRVGAVCAVPDSEPTQLAQFFGSRDVSQIKDGLAKLMESEATRLAEARQRESDKGQTNPEVTKMYDALFTHGEKLIKLLDPSYRPGASGPGQQSNTFVFNGVGAGDETPQELMARAFQYLLDQGVPRESITSDMVMDLLKAPGDNLEQKAIEASVVIRRELADSGD